MTHHVAIHHPRHRWHHRMSRRLIEFHRREGAFTAIAFSLLFFLGLAQVLANQLGGTDSPEWVRQGLGSLKSIGQSEATAQTLRVDKVIDGDTVVLENGEYIRYIGIDAPEIFPEEECFAKEATIRNRELVEGKEVKLVRDVSDLDPFNRQLRYVYVGDRFINETLVKEGYALAVIYPPDTKFASQLQLAERLAEVKQTGLWKKCSRE